MRDLTDFAVREEPADNLMAAISWPWCNCSYTMAAKPIKSLELHYTMIQFLIIPISWGKRGSRSTESVVAQLVDKRFFFSKSLIIHTEKTKEITRMMEVWKSVLFKL